MNDAPIPAGLMTVAWRDFLLFAICHEPLREAYKRDTGHHFLSEPTEDFAFWATLTQWGDEGVPAAFLDAARARFPRPSGEDHPNEA